MKIAELVETLDLPQTEVAEHAWEDGRRRVRRRRGVVAAGAAAVAVACVVAVTIGTRPEHATAPTGPSPTRTVGPHTAPLVQRLLTGGRLQQEVPNMDFQRFGGHLERAVPLSSHPVDRAAIAMAYYKNEATALVLGEDGEWRRVDVPGLVPVHDQDGYTSPVVRPTSLSPDATKLALPQPDGLVVVDLTDGTSRRYDVPGSANTYAIWADESHVLVAEETASHGTLVDLEDGSLERSTYGPSTRFAGNTTLTWTREHGPLLHSVLQWGDGRTVRTEANNAGGFFPQPPLVRDDVVVGVEGVYASGGELPFDTVGIVAVDGSTGKVLAYLPLGHLKATNALLLGWDGARPIVGVPLPGQKDALGAFAWDWRAGDVDSVGVVGAWTSWGTGQVNSQ